MNKLLLEINKAVDNAGGCHDPYNRIVSKAIPKTHGQSRNRMPRTEKKSKTLKRAESPDQNPGISWSG